MRNNLTGKSNLQEPKPQGNTMTGEERLEYWRKVYRNPRLMPWQICSLDGMTWWRKALSWTLWHIGDVLERAGKGLFCYM